MFIGKINPKLASRSFLGYVDKEASEKKIVRDVMKHGDSAFISGTLCFSVSIEDKIERYVLLKKQLCRSEALLSLLVMLYLFDY